MPTAVLYRQSAVRRLIVLRIGARPEEVTNTQRSVNVASLPLVP